MTHEPECWSVDGGVGEFCCCEEVRAAYQRGFDAGEEEGYMRGFAAGLAQGYRQGYNDHAASRVKAEAIYGQYGKRPNDVCPEWHQHGKGENP